MNQSSFRSNHCAVIDLVSLWDNTCTFWLDIVLDNDTRSRCSVYDAILGECLTGPMCLLQKIALDKLSVKVHKMYGKVKEASMLSVRPEVIDPKKGQQPSLIQQLERKCSRHVRDVAQSLGTGRQRYLSIAFYFLCRECTKVNSDVSLWHCWRRRRACSCEFSLEHVVFIQVLESMFDWTGLIWIYRSFHYTFYCRTENDELYQISQT